MKYEMEIITPVHIGTGEQFSQIDGFYENGQWHRIDVEAVLAVSSESELDRLTLAMAERGFQWQKYLPTNGQFARYTLPCPEDPREAEIREAMKTNFSRPIIPGSSIKGAIRTALLWEFLNDDENREAFNYAVNNLKGQLGQRTNRAWAGQQIERRVLGSDPSHDLMRAVQVSDTASIPTEALELGLGWIVTLDRDEQLVQKREGNREYKTFVEQIQAEQQLEFSIKIDKTLFRQREKRELGYSERHERTLCEELAGVCNSVTKGLIKAESNFFESYHLIELANFYDALLERVETLSDDAFIVPLGWGTGYRAKTVTELLIEGESDLMMNLRQHYRMGASRERRDYYHPEFPKTRRVLYDGHGSKCPPGWVQITPKG